MKEKSAKDKIKTKELHKEIDLIQACITRMADNSFRLKELYISLISIALTVMMSQKCELLIVGMFLLGVAIVFWGLDAFFLKMETLMPLYGTMIAISMILLLAPMIMR